MAMFAGVSVAARFVGVWLAAWGLQALAGQAPASGDVFPPWERESNDTIHRGLEFGHRGRAHSVEAALAGKVAPNKGRVTRSPNSSNVFS